MRRSNSLLALIVGFLVLVSAGFFYKGIEEFQNTTLPSPSVASTQVSSSPAVLGQQSESTSSATFLEGKTRGKIIKVVDGDTVEVEIDGKREKLRYIGVDTPETVDPRRGVQCFGREASEENKRIVFGKEVYLEKDISDRDRFGRMLGYVYLKADDGSIIFINDHLVRQGFAKSLTYPPDVKYSERFRMAEQEAREGKRGLWGRCES